MADVKKYTNALLGSGVANMQAGDAKTIIYTVPVGRTAIITHVVVRSPSGSLNATGTGSYNFGSGATANSFKTAVNLDTLTAVTDYIALYQDVKLTMEVAGSAFGVLPHATNGAVADVTATIDIFGYEF